MRDPSVFRAAPAAKLYRGWLVVAGAFLVAMFGFGLGFYGPGIYLVVLKARHGWSTGELASAISVYYVLGAGLLFFVVGPLFDRWGARTVVIIGTVAMACGVVSLTLVARPWQAYTAFGVMSLGWATMSGAAINIIVAPWFERRRGLALSWALNGGSAGGVVVAPLLVLSISRFGFAVGLDTAAAVMLACLIPVAMLVLRPKRPDERDAADRRSELDNPSSSYIASPDEIAGFRLRIVLRSRAFITTTIPFALGLTAQVGVLTHLVALVMPTLGASGAAAAVSTTTAAAILGRLMTGVVVDRTEPRLVAATTLGLQIIGVTLLAWAPSAAVAYTGCTLFGLGVGNLTTLPGLILAAEWPTEQFGALIGLAVGINQLTFAFGPSLVGVVRDWSGGYAPALGLCAVLQLGAAMLVLLGRSRTRAGPTGH